VSTAGGADARLAANPEFSLWAGSAISYHSRMGLIAYIAYVTGGFVFLGSAAAQVYARVRLRPPAGSDVDETYYEFEDEDPEYARYNRWLTITNAGVALGMLLLFLGVVL